MKHFLLLIVFCSCCCIPNARAMCLPGGLSVWPHIPDTVLSLPRNPTLLLFWDHHRDNYITDLEKSGLFLKSGGEYRRLRFIRRYDSNGCKAIFVKAEKDLTPGKTYCLWSRHDPEFLKQFAWKIERRRDVTTPTWIKEPAHSHNIYRNLGCGPEIYAVFCGCTWDDSFRIPIARLHDRETGEIIENVIPPGMEFLEIGRGMCGGPFEFIEGRSYQASFSIIDVAGNQSAFNAPVSFATPSPENAVSKPYPICPQCPNRRKDTLLFYLLLTLFGILIVIGTVTFFIVRRRKRTTKR